MSFSSRFLYSWDPLTRCTVFCTIFLTERDKGDLAVIATNYTAVRNNLKGYCDLATDQNETVVVTRKENKNVVIMSLERFTLMEKAIRNMIQDALDKAGYTVVKGTNRNAV